ncbi:DnaA ATPase domain-containing protein [Escherichia coli]
MFRTWLKPCKTTRSEKVKRYYRSVNALLIDDIQFFVNKDDLRKSFSISSNALLEGNRQITLLRASNTLSERDRQRSGSFLNPTALGTDCGDQTARAGNPCGDPDEKGRRKRHSFAG